MVVTRHASQKNAVDRVQPDKSRKNPPERRRIAVTSVLQLLPLALFFLGFPTPRPPARPSLSCFLLCSFRRLISDDGINQQDYHKWRNDPPREGVSEQTASGTFPVWRMFVYAGREGGTKRANEQALVVTREPPRISRHSSPSKSVNAKSGENSSPGSREYIYSM